VEGNDDATISSPMLSRETRPPGTEREPQGRPRDKLGTPGPPLPNPLCPGPETPPKSAILGHRHQVADLWLQLAARMRSRQAASYRLGLGLPEVAALLFITYRPLTLYLYSPPSSSSEANPAQPPPACGPLAGKERNYDEESHSDHKSI